MASIIKCDTIQSTTSNVFFQNSVGTEYARFDSTGVFQLVNPSSFAAGTAAAPSITATGDTNTGIFFPAADTIGFSEGGAEIARFDSSGNFGLGVTPTAWSAGGKIIELGFKGNIFYGVSYTAVGFSNNAYYDATATSGWKFANPTSSRAGYYEQSQGTHAWATSTAAGTAGNTATFTHAMTLDASGNLLVGTTSGASARIYAEGGASYHSVRGLANTAGLVAIYGTSSNNSATGYCAYFNNSGSSTGLFISNTAAWQSTSDQRLKTDVKDLDSTSKLLQLRAVDYLWKSQETSEQPDKRNFGFIAQEVKEIFPDLVGVSPDGMFSVEYTGLIAPLVKAIQEQQALITTLTARITALEGA